MNMDQNELHMTPFDIHPSYKISLKSVEYYWEETYRQMNMNMYI
jgi:hypothetical protein